MKLYGDSLAYSATAARASKVPVCYYMRSGVLMRKWRLPTVATDEEWQVSHQIVVSNCYHKDFNSKHNSCL